jgi:hypothetical protein
MSSYWRKYDWSIDTAGTYPEDQGLSNFGVFKLLVNPMQTMGK